MEIRKTVSVALLLACFVVVSQAEPSFDAPSGYPGGFRRAAEPATDDSVDDFLADASPSNPASTWPGLLPVLKPKPAFIPPTPIGGDPAQFIQMKATILKNLFGPGGAKSSPATRSAAPPPSKTKVNKWATPAAPSKAAPSKAAPSKAAPIPPKPKKIQVATPYWDPAAEQAYWTPSAAPSQPAPGSPPAAPSQPAPWSPPAAPSQPAPGSPPAAPSQPAPWSPPAAPSQPAPWTPPTAPSQPSPWTPPAGPSQPAAVVRPLSPAKKSGSPKNNAASGTPPPPRVATPYWDPAAEQAYWTPSAAPSQPAPWSPPAAPSQPAPWSPPAAPSQPAPWTPPAAPSQPAPAASPYPTSWTSGSSNAQPAPPSYASWTPTSATPTPDESADKKAALIEALLEEYYSEDQSPSSRFARTPIGPAPQPSPYLADLLDSLNLTTTPSLTPTIEPPGFWFPDIIATPGGAKPYAVDPSSVIAKKTKFLSDLFTQKAALTARAVDLTEYTAKVSDYLKKIFATTTGTAETSSGSEAPENVLRKKRDIDDVTDAPSSDNTISEDITPDTATPDTATPDTATADNVTVANDLAIIKQNIFVQLEEMKKARALESKTQRVAAKAAKATALAALLGLPAPPTTAPLPTAVPPVPLEDYQQRLAALTSLYGSLAALQKNITSPGTPVIPGLLSSDQLFINAVNDKAAEIVFKSALAKARVARSNNYYPWWRDQQQDPSDSDPSQLENDKETSRHQKAAVPLVAAVFAPETHHHISRKPYWWH